MLRKALGANKLELYDTDHQMQSFLQMEEVLLKGNVTFNLSDKTYGKKDVTKFYLKQMIILHVLQGIWQTPCPDI